MSARDEAIAHLAKAGEFLAAAEHELSVERFNAAASNAVTSAINAKDAICLILTGQSAKTRNHANTVAELKAAGPTGAKVATDLRRLLAVKARSQYLAAGVSAGQARRAVEQARRIHDAAKEIVAG